MDKGIDVVDKIFDDHRIGFKFSIVDKSSSRIRRPQLRNPQDRTDADPSSSSRTPRAATEDHGIAKIY